ncbi:MAG: glutathione S-transferase family protein [Pigmentiphaga sp.]
MAEIVLIEHPRSPYAQKVRILLREKGLSFTTELPAGLGSGVLNDELRRLNPRLEVPMLRVGDARLFDSSIILAFLEETYPAPALMPAEPAARARARMIEEVCDTHWEAMNWGLGEVDLWHRGGETLGPVLHAAAERDAHALYRWLGQQLGDAAWLSGDRFGWADVCAAPFIATTVRFGLCPEPGSNVAKWFDRVKTRPAVRDTIAEAAALHHVMPELVTAMENGAFKRQYRDHRLEWMIRAGGMQVVLDGLAKNNIRFTDLGLFDPEAKP